MALTPKQQRFVEEYLADPHLNAAAAYRRAGYKATGHSAEVNASRLLKKAEVAEAVQIAVEKRQERVEITQDWVLTQLQKEAQLTGEGSSHAARIRAIELLGKHLRMFADQLEVKTQSRLLIVEEEYRGDDDRAGEIVARTD